MCVWLELRGCDGCRHRACIVVQYAAEVNEVNAVVQAYMRRLLGSKSMHIEENTNSLQMQMHAAAVAACRRTMC
jgi:hypothetical protein